MWGAGALPPALPLARTDSEQPSCKLRASLAELCELLLC